MGSEEWRQDIKTMLEGNRPCEGHYGGGIFYARNSTSTFLLTSVPEIKFEK